MNAELSASQIAELAKLIEALYEEQITPDEAARLDQWIGCDEAARWVYMQYANMYAGLCWDHGAGGEVCDQCADLQIELDNHEASVPWPREHGAFAIEPSAPGVPADISRIRSPILGFPISLVHDTVGHFSSGWPVAYLVAIVICGMGLVIGAFVQVSTPVQVVRQSVPSPSPLASRPSSQQPFVGRITGMVDCQWADPNTAAFNGAHVPLERKYALASGLLEITYDTGAKVILQGPVTYEIESAAGGYLSLGRLTARVESRETVRSTRRSGKAEDQKSETSNPQSPIPNPSLPTIHYPLFTVKTPTAIVTDLGTEFGVEVGNEGQTFSYVFRGLVRVQPVAADGKPQGDGQLLREKESATVENPAAAHVVALDRSARPVEFVRKIPKQAITTLDLVDLVAGGNGFAGQRNRGIDPTTGRISDAQPGSFFPALAGDGQYHRVPDIPLVDGVFIPNGGSGPVQVDSAGHAFDGFNKTDNLTYGHIWAGGPIAMPDSPKAICTTLRGIDDYASPGHGLLLIHANGGITFDLDAIRRATGSRRIMRFRAVAGNAATMAETKTVYADLWVLVDGKKRFVRGQEAGRVGPVLVGVPLNENDRFLTLAFTDGGDGCGWDWTILGDPRLDIVVTEKQKTTDSDRP
jgi:hypothetical protein